MTLGDAITKYVDYNQSIGMRFQVDAAILTAFHRHAGDVDLTAISPDVVAAFLQPRHRVTSTWRMKHRALRRFYHQAIARALGEHGQRAEDAQWRSPERRFGLCQPTWPPADTVRRP